MLFGLVIYRRGSSRRRIARDLAADTCFHARLSRKAPAVRSVYDDHGMGQNFIACDRDQSFLMPPDVRDWLPDNHLAWFVIDAVAVIDLDAFYRAYRADGHGRPAYQPSMMVALLLYRWSRGIRSSRAIERACVEDVACRVIAAQQRPDHATIARFIERHEHALGDLFGEVLALCADAGLATVGVIAIDGTKVSANANRDRTLGYEQIARAIVDEAIACDQADDDVDAQLALPDPVGERLGRQVWLRRARQDLDRRLAQQAAPIPARGRSDCLRPSAASRSSSLSSVPPTVATSTTERTAARRTAGCWAPRPSPTRRPRCRTERSTSPIWTRGSCTGCAAGCRATTPKRSATTSTSSSPPTS